jgi:hypothetical protein
MKKNSGLVINRFCIFELVCQAYQEAMKPKTVTNSFRKSGIYPFNHDAIDKTWFKPATIFSQKNQSEFLS